MKKVLGLIFALFLVAVTVASCSMDEEPNVNFQMEFLAIQSVEAPEVMVPGNTYTFKLYYNRPTDCYYYNGLVTEQNGNLFTVGVQAILLTEGNCQEIEHAEAEVASFDFQCPLSSFTEYKFRFYTGGTTGGNATADGYTERTIPVEQ